MQVLTRVGTFNIRHGSLPRSKNLHVTPILREIALKLRMLRKQEDDEDLDLLLLKYPDWQTGDRAVFNRVSLGLAFEDWLGRQIPSTVYHFGEVEKDGIVGTPDGIIDPCSDTERVLEIKVTWKTSNQERRPIAGEWMWIKQCASYCAMLGLLVVELHVLFVNGDYHGSGPQYVIFTLIFTPEEIAATWRIVMSHKHLIENRKD